jgi:N12 class adenine-specific DNA methylase/adenine-specific DNA methylase
MANPLLTDEQQRKLANQNSAYNQIMQGYAQPQQADTANDDGFLGAAKRAGVGTLASMAGGLGYLVGAEGMADSLQKTAQDNARLRDYDSIWNWQYATDPYGLWYDIVSTGASAAALMPFGAMIPAGAAAGAAGLAGRTLAKYGGNKVAQWAASKAGQAALTDMARGAVGSVPEALSEWGNTAQEANAMGMENPRLGTIGDFAANMAILPVSNALEYSLLKGSLFRPSAKEGETWLQRLYKAPTRALPAVGAEGIQNSTEELLQTTASDSALGKEVGNPLNPFDWTDSQRQAWQKGLAGSIGLGSIPGVYRATQVQEQQAELDNQKPVQGFDGKYWYEKGYQPLTDVQEKALPMDNAELGTEVYDGIEGSINAEGKRSKYNLDDYATMNNPTLTPDQYLAMQNGFNSEQLGASSLNTALGSTKMPNAFMSKLFEQTMQEELAKQQAAERARKGAAFAEAASNTPMGKGVMPEIVNPINGDTLSQPFSLGTITKATQNKALGATPSAYTARKAMATGNAVTNPINITNKAGLNQSNMPIGSAQNLRQQVNAANLALAANRGATDKTAFQPQVVQQPGDVNATADRLMAEQAITNLFDNARLLPPEYYDNKNAQQQNEAELAQRRRAIANILGNVATQKWDATQQEYGNRRQQALQNIANIVNARAAGKWDNLEDTNASKQQSLQGISNIVNALAAGRFDKAEADSQASVDAKERQKAAQAIANIVNARAAGMWDTNEAENQAKVEARQAIANIVNARAAQQWDNAEKGTQNEKAEQKREVAKNTQGAKAEEKQNTQANQNVKQPKEEKPVEKKPEKIEEPKTETKGKANLPEGVTVDVNYNEDKKSVELKFNISPGKEVTSKLSASGYRWSKQQQHWWAKQSNANAMELAKHLEGTEEKPIPKLSSDKVTIFTDGSFKGSKIATDKLNEHNDQALIDYLKENGWTRNHDFTDAPFIYRMETNLNKESFDFVRNWTGKPIEINGFGDTANTYDDYVKYIEDFKARQKAKEDKNTPAKDSTNKADGYAERKAKLENAIEKDMSKYPNINFDKKKTGSLYKGQTWREAFKNISHNRDVYINVDYYVTDNLLDDAAFKGYSLVGIDNKGNIRNAIPREFNDFIKDNFVPSNNKDTLIYKGLSDINSISDTQQKPANTQNLTTEQDKFDFKREDMTEAFGKLLGIDSVMSYDDAVNKFGEDRLNKGQVVLHIPKDDFYFVVYKYDRNETAKHGNKYHVDGYNSKVELDANNTFDAHSLEVVASSVKNPFRPLPEAYKPITRTVGNSDNAMIEYNKNNSENGKTYMAKAKDWNLTVKLKDNMITVTWVEGSNPFKISVEEYQKAAAGSNRNSGIRKLLVPLAHKQQEEFVNSSINDIIRLSRVETLPDANDYADVIKNNIDKVLEKAGIESLDLMELKERSSRKQATATTFTDNPESLINEDALNNMSLEQLNTINNMFDDGKKEQQGMENDNQGVVQSKVEKSTKEVTDNGNNEGRYSEVPRGQVSEGSGRSQEERNVEQAGTGQLHVGEQQVQRPETKYPKERPNTEGRNNDGGIQENPRSGKSSAGTAERGNDVLTPAQKKDAKASEIPGHNYTITEKSLGEGGPKTKYENNINAIKLLKKLEAEGRLATPSEQKILAKYVGWGGLSSVFSINASGNAMDPAWTKEAKEVKELLTSDEYKAARASTNTAFYTPVGVIKNIYKMLDRLGFKSGKILEPSMGTGNFFGVMPKGMKENSALNGVEIDPLTAKIAKQLYQKANIEQTGYEGTKYPDNYFDVVISNVPFGVSIYDPKYAKYSFKSHNYFFAKAMDQVRPGGLVCFVTSTDTMQGSADSKKLRELLKGKADLIAAVRLPNTTFKGNAGTEVTSDVIILQKREPGTLPSKYNQEWLNYEDSGVVSKWGEHLKINEYYAKHPDMLIGELKAGGQWGSLILDGTGVDVEQAMQKLVSKLPKDIYKPRTSTRNTNSIESAKTFLAPSKSREGTLLVHTDGLVYHNNQGKMEVLVETAQEKAKDYIQLRDAVKTLLQAQVDPQTTDEQLDEQRVKLNEAYDNFVKKHGYVNAPKNINALGIDPDYGIIESIEDYQVDPLDKKKVTAKKRAVFTQRTVNPVIEVTKADNINDALSLSLSNTGNVDLAYISKLLGGQSESSIVEELGDRVYNNPVTEGYELAEEYLSGNVREKLEIAEMAAKANPAYKRNIEALKKVQPKDLQQEDISVGLGTPWIPTSDIQQFAADLLNTRRDALDIRYVPQTGSWLVDWGWTDYNTKNGVENTQTWGTADKSFKELLSHALNQSTPTVKYKDENGNYHVDAKATLAAQAKLKEIQAKFKDWIWQDKTRADRLLAYYNRNYNNWVLREYDGSALTFPGYSTAEPALKDHQKNAVWRIIQDGTALIAHCVGSGKTWTMQTAAMELKRLGLANKSMFVIPNHMLQQFENEFRRIYPNAKLLTLSNDTLPDVNIPGASKMKPLERKRRRALKNAKRQATLSKIATEDWDGIIISHNLFKRIPMSPTKYNEFYETQLAELEQALIEAKQESRGKDPGVKELEKAKKSLETKLKRDIKEEEKDIVIPFEQLGIDQIFVDEADMFKNLYFPTKMTRIAGMSNTNSQRSMDMFMKTQYIQSTNNGRGVVFATGTPISNTMAEMFTMLRYLDMKGLKEKNLGFFDNWASTFATKETATELAPDGSGYRSVEKFTKFNNMPELIKMFRKVADVKKREDLDIKVPDLKNNKPTVIEVPMNSALKTYIDEEASRRANAIHNKQVDPTEDNMLKLTGDLRKASLDIRLVDPTVPAAVSGAKVQAVIDHTYAKYEETADKKGVQLIFCDLSTPKGASDKELISDNEESEEQEDNTNITVYEEIKKGLIKKGVPANQVAFIHDAKTKAAKEQLFERCRRGDIRVLIGSTEKMGAGTNIQKKLVALHHVDAPWRPRDIEQREGRILRQGNENEEVEIFNYVTKGSFDANMWEKIKNKATMIGQAMSGDLTQRTLEDTDATVLSFAEIEALASGNPLMAERVMVNAKLNQYSALADNYKKDQAKNKRELATLPITLKVLEEKMQGAKEDIKKRIDIKGDNFSIQIGGTTYDSRTKAKEAIEKSIDNVSLPTIKLGGFDVKGKIYLKGEAFKDAYGNVHRAEMTTYRAEVIGKNVYPCEYTLGSMEYTVMNMPDKIYVSAKNGIESTQKRIKAIEAELNKPFKYQEEYEKLQKRSDEIEAELQKMNEAPSAEDIARQALELLNKNDAPSNDGVTQYSVAQTAYHGTNRIFNKFTMDHLREGSGGLTHGYGLYFAKDEKVANAYRAETAGDGAGMEFTIDGVRYRYDREAETFIGTNDREISVNGNSAENLLANALYMTEDEADAIDYLKENSDGSAAYRRAISLAENGNIKITKAGATYETLIPGNDELLDEDKIFSQQPKAVQKGLQKAFAEVGASREFNTIKAQDSYGADIYTKLMQAIMGDNTEIDDNTDFIENNIDAARQASELLNKNGIKGLHYWEKGDKDAFVVFSDEAIKIQRQYMLGNIDEVPTRTRAEVEAEIKKALPNAKLEIQKDGGYVATMPNGKRLGIYIEDKILLNEQQAAQAGKAHNRTASAAEGYWNAWERMTDASVDGVLRVSRNSRIGTAFHETLHAAMDLCLNDKERAALYKYFSNKAKETGRSVDEEIADAYKEWVIKRQKGQGSMFGKLYQKAKDFLNKLYTMFIDANNKGNIFRKLESGKAWEQLVYSEADAPVFNITPASIKKFVNAALNNPNSALRLLLGKVTDAEAKAILEATGINVDGYTHVWRGEDVRHINNQHGEGNEKQADQIGLTEEEITQALEIIKAPTSIKKGTRYKGRDSIRFIKAKENGEYTVVEVVGTKKKQLAVKTMWHKKEAATTIHHADKNSPQYTSEIGSGNTASDDNVTSNAGEVKWSVAPTKSKIASAFTNTERKGTIQSAKDFFKEHWNSFYSDYVDKNDVLHAFDGLTKAKGGLTLYEQVQNLPSTTAGFLKAMSEGTAKHIDVANQHLKNVKMKHRVTLAMALNAINKETMDKAHPDYLKQNGFDSWVNALGAYLGAERLLEMNAIAKAQGEEYKLPKGLTEAELRQFTRNVPVEFKKAADIFYKVNDNMISVMEDAGVFSHELAQVLRTKYKKYCPLLRDFSDTAAADSFINGLTTGGRGIGNVSIPLKKISISGSERGVLNPLETVLKSYAVMLNRAERNKVGLMAVNTAKEAGMEDIIQEVPEVIGKNGEVVNAVADPKNCVFTVLVNGKKKAYKTTQELYGPIVGYNVPAAGLVFGVARTAAKMLRTGATMSPGFILRNVIRDTFFAGVSSKNGFIPILDTLRGMKALWSDPALRAEFEAAGVTEFNFYSSQEQRIKSIDRMAGEKPVGLWEMIKWTAQHLEAASDFFESSTRMGEFMKARKKGLSIEEAARAAREVTLDFSRSGRVGEQINQVVPFFNACIQGGDKMRRLFKEDFRGTSVKLFKYIVLPSLLLWCINHDDDWYKDLDPDIKNNYWCLGKNIRIPKPQEAGVIFGSGFEALLDQANGKDPEAMKNWKDAVFANMAPSLIPTLILPLLEWQANYSRFKGRPIVSAKYQRLPDELQYTDYTSETSKGIGSVLKVSPMKVDNLVRGYTGTMGALLWSLPDYATDKAKNQPAKNWYEYAPFRDFAVTDANLSRPLNDFYGMLDAANRQHTGYGVKGKPTQAVQAIRKTGMMISNIRKDIDKITKSRLTAERKRQLIDQRKAKMNQLARQATEKYGKYFD